MKFAEFIRSKLIGKKSYEISSEDFENYYNKYEATKFNLTEIALFTAIDLIARSIAKCEFVTVENHKEKQGYEYYTWNYSPNKHQTKIEFITEFISKLIFNNEALIFETSDGQLLVADSFSKQEYAILEDTFSSITARGLTLNRTYKSSEVIYLKYSDSGVRRLLSQMCKSFENLMCSAEQRYTKAVGHKGILKISNIAQNDVEFQQKFNDLMKNRFLQYFKAQKTRSL